MTTFLQTNIHADEDFLPENSSSPILSYRIIKQRRGPPQNFMQNLQNKKALANSSTPVIPSSIKELIEKEITVVSKLLSGKSNNIYRKLLDKRKDNIDIAKKSSIIIGPSRQNLYPRISELCMKSNSNSNNNSNNVSMHKNKQVICEDLNDLALKLQSKIDLNLVVTNKSQNQLSLKTNEKVRIHDKTTSSPTSSLKKISRSHSGIKKKV